MSDRPQGTSQPENVTSQAVDVFINEHKLSSIRDDAYTRPADAKSSACKDQIEVTSKNAQKALELLKAGKPLPDELRRSLINMHDNSATAVGDDQDKRNTAIKNDPIDMKKEQDVIRADKELLKLPNMSHEFRRMVEKDINSKTLLIAGEKKDYWNSAGYLKHDKSEQAVDQRVANALKTNSADLIPALEASIASKNQIIKDRADEAKFRPQLYDLKFEDATTNTSVIMDLQRELHQNHASPTPPQSGPPEPTHS